MLADPTYRATLAATALAVASLFAAPAWAHDHWISHNFAWCCGDEDCAPVRTDNVRVVPGGYLIIQTGEVIPESQALPSVDGEYWRCQYLTGPLKGQTRCFFRGHAGS